MTQYEKLNFVNGSPPALNAATLNHMEDGIAAATEGVTAVEKNVRDNKTETNTALSTKADKSTTYTKNEVDTALATKADKTEIDTALATKPSFDDVYTVEEAEEHFLSKHDAGNTYATKAELVTKANKETTYTKAEVDTALAGKLDNTEGSVTTDNIASKAVTSDKIANGAITSLKLANNAVSGSNIAQSQISTNHLQSGAVTVDKLADKSVAIAKLSDDLLAYIKSNSGTGNGKSAYEVAVDNGFTGTQEEWLASLKGSDYILTDADKTDIANIVINEYENSIMALVGGD